MKLSKFKYPSINIWFLMTLFILSALVGDDKYWAGVYLILVVKSVDFLLDVMEYISNKFDKDIKKGAK